MFHESPPRPEYLSPNDTVCLEAIKRHVQQRRSEQKDVSPEEIGDLPEVKVWWNQAEQFADAHTTGKGRIIVTMRWGEIQAQAGFWRFAYETFNDALVAAQNMNEGELEQQIRILLEELSSHET